MSLVNKFYSERERHVVGEGGAGVCGDNQQRGLLRLCLKKLTEYITFGNLFVLKRTRKGTELFVV